MAQVFKCDRCEEIWPSRTAPEAVIEYQQWPFGSHLKRAWQLCPTCAEALWRELKTQPAKSLDEELT